MRMAEGDLGRDGGKAMWSSTPSRRCVPAWAPKSTASSGLDNAERRAMQRRQGRVAAASHEWGDERVADPVVGVVGKRVDEHDRQAELRRGALDGRSAGTLPASEMWNVAEGTGGRKGSEGAR